MSESEQRELLVSAIGADHPCDQLSSCDIAMARQAGFAFAAADLLRGATETPSLDAAIARIGEHAFRRGLQAEFSDWADWYAEHTVECAACGGFVARGSSACGHCLAPLAAAA